MLSLLLMDLFQFWSRRCRLWSNMISDLQKLWFTNQRRKLFKGSCEKKSYMQKLNSIETYMKKRRILQHAMFVISKISKQLKGAQKEESWWNSYEVKKHWKGTWIRRKKMIDYETCNFCDFNSIRLWKSEIHISKYIDIV